MSHFVYILASHPNSALHIGRAGNLRQRLDAHKMGFVAHTQRHGMQTLVWFEEHSDFDVSQAREKQLRRMRRAERDRLIEAQNPDWRDMTAHIPNPTGGCARAGVKWGIHSGVG